jgi:hypothetical protein
MVMIHQNLEFVIRQNCEGTLGAAFIITCSESWMS